MNVWPKVSPGPSGPTAAGLELGSFRDDDNGVAGYSPSGAKSTGARVMFTTPNVRFMHTIPWSEVAALIDGAGLAHLATASPEGEPHVALVSAVRDGDAILIATRTTSGKARDLRANPRVSLMWQGNSAETYLWGDVSLITDSPTKVAVWNSGLFPFPLEHFFGAAESDGWVLVRATPTRVVAMVQTESALERRVWQRT